MSNMIMSKNCKHRFHCVNNEKGMVALVTIIIVAAATLIMAFNASLLGIGELDLGYTSQKASEAMSVADSCAEEALRRLRFDSGYSGGSLNVGDGSCIIDIVNSGNYIIIVDGSVGEYNKKIQLDVILNGSNTIIDSWQEVEE